MEAEYVTACEVAKEVVWLQKFWMDLKVAPTPSHLITLNYDNSEVVANSKVLRSHKKVKHIERKFNLICNIVERGKEAVCKIVLVDNLVDLYMKAQPAKSFEGQLVGLGI